MCFTLFFIFVLYIFKKAVLCKLRKNVVAIFFQVFPSLSVEEEQCHLNWPAGNAMPQIGHPYGLCLLFLTLFICGWSAAAHTVQILAKPPRVSVISIHSLTLLQAPISRT